MPNPLRQGGHKPRRHQGIPIGTRFGMLVIDSSPELASHGNYYYVCKCDCGNSQPVRYTDLKTSVRSCRSCGVKVKRDLRESLKHVRQELGGPQGILYKALLNRPRQVDAGFAEVEREAYAIAIASTDPIAEFNLFFPKHRVEYPTACSGLNNSSKPDRGHRRGRVASRIGG